MPELKAKLADVPGAISETLCNELVGQPFYNSCSQCLIPALTVGGWICKITCIAHAGIIQYDAYLVVALPPYFIISKGYAKIGD